jgi:glycosyltransferase involved in cell wall biosynthesis
MKILFVTITWPDSGQRNLYYDLMHEFKKNGHKIYVAYADEKIDETKVVSEEGISVLRMSSLQIRKAGKLKKVLSLPLLGLRFKRNINQLFKGENFDLIIGHTPPITLSGLMKYLKKKHNAFFYLLLKDIWPHSSVDLKIIKKNGLVYKFFRWHEKRIYLAADVIGCMSPMNVDYVLNNNKFLTSDEVEECPNSITPRILESGNGSEILSKYNIPQDATVFIFSGNLSKGHGLEYYVEVIEELKKYKKAFFLIGGSGTYYNYLKRTLDEKKLKNVFLYEWLPKEDFNEILLTSDVGVILLSSEYTVPQFPSRLLAYLEASKPVLCAVNQDTDIGMIVEDAGCGISTIHGEKENFISAIKFLSENSNERKKLAGNARALLESEYTSKRAYNIIMKHIN